MIARIVTGVVIAAWTAYLTHATIAALHPAVDPLPHGLRTALPIALLGGTILVALAFLGRWLLAQLRDAHGLNVYPRRDGWEPPMLDGACRNAQPPESHPLAVRIVRPARAIGRAPVDDSPTVDLLAELRTIHPAVLEAGQRIAAALRQ